MCDSVKKKTVKRDICSKNILTTAKAAKLYRKGTGGRFQALPGDILQGKGRKWRMQRVYCLLNVL